MSSSLIFTALILIDIAFLLYLYLGDKLLLNSNPFGFGEDSFRYSEFVSFHLSASAADRTKAEEEAKENKEINKMLGRENLKKIYYWRMRVKIFIPIILLLHLLLFVASADRSEKNIQSEPQKKAAPKVKEKAYPDIEY